MPEIINIHAREILDSRGNPQSKLKSPPYQDLQRGQLCLQAHRPGA